jgi:hypothetical protein
MGEECFDCGKDLREIISSLEKVAKEAEGGSETERFLILLSWLNEELTKRGVGRIIIVGGFAAEIYSARAYRTGDVDIIVEGDVKFVREFLKVVSDVGLRIYLLKFPQFAEKGIDIVGDRYEKQMKAVKLSIKGRTIYIIPPEEVVISSLAAWKFWNSVEDRDKAYLVYAAQREHIDSEYLRKRAAEEGVEKEMEEMIKFVTKE